MMDLDAGAIGTDKTPQREDFRAGAGFGVRYAFDQAAQTNDIDIASFERLSLALEDTVSEPLTKVLADFEFDAVPSLDRSKAWRWRQSR